MHGQPVFVENGCCQFSAKFLRGPWDKPKYPAEQQPYAKQTSCHRRIALHSANGCRRYQHQQPNAADYQSGSFPAIGQYNIELLLHCAYGYYLSTPAPNRAKSYFIGPVGYRMALELLRRGLAGRERRGRFFYHYFTRAAEDALPVVRGK